LKICQNRRYNRKSQVENEKKEIAKQKGTRLRNLHETLQHHGKRRNNIWTQK
jgi:hypothetical protein